MDIFRARKNSSAELYGKNRKKNGNTKRKERFKNSCLLENIEKF